MRPVAEIVKALPRWPPTQDLRHSAAIAERARNVEETDCVAPERCPVARDSIHVVIIRVMNLEHLMDPLPTQPWGLTTCGLLL